MGIWKLWQYAATHIRIHRTFVVNNVMCWNQVLASKLFRRIIAAITDNSDQITI